MGSTSRGTTPVTVTSQFKPTHSTILVHSKTNSEEMAFLSNQFLRGILFFAVGGVSSVAILKIWENRESLLREIRRRFDSNDTRQPEEHDERFDWEGKNSVSYENIISKSDRMMNILEQARYMDVPFIVTALS